MTRRRLILAAIPCLLAAAEAWPWRSRTGRGGADHSPLDGLPADRAGVPDWKIDERFKDDVFTFVRVQYNSSYGMGRRGRWGGGLGRPTGPTATSTSPTASSSSPRSRSIPSRSPSS